MSLRGLTALALCLSGCSLLFDPAQVPPACPSQPPANPATLIATVGEQPGKIAWTWPAVDGGAGYRFCTSVSGSTEQCRDLTAGSTCDGGQCAASTEGLDSGVRLTGVVRALDECDQVGTVAPPSTSVTPLDTSSAAEWLHERSSECVTATPSVLGGVVALEQTGSAGQVCTTSFVTGDELWGDFTLEANLRFSALANRSISGGFAVHLNSTGYRMLSVIAPNEVLYPRRSQFYRRKDGAELVLATSTAAAHPTESTFLRLVSKGGVLSFQVGATRESAKEVMRMPEATRTGRIGVAARGTGRIELSNVRLTTAASLPEAAPKSVNVGFAGGSASPELWVPVAANLPVGPCPALPSSPRCDGGCAPPAGSQCGFCQMGLYQGAAGLDLPVGLDPRDEWSMSTRFAIPPGDGGLGLFPILVGTPRAALLSANTWGTENTGLGQSFGVTLERGTWHTAAWNFQPDAGRWSVALDGQPVTLPNSAFPPPADGVLHLGSFAWCDGTTNALVLHELSITQN